MKLQIALEESFLEIGQMVTDQNVVILIVRGLLDGSAYVTRQEWQALMDDMNMNIVSMRDNRYDAVLHMVTAADGAVKFYASLSNEARYESVSEAVAKDKKLREVYMGHKHWVMVDNSFKDFNSKIKFVVKSVHKVLNHQGGTQFYKKFLLKKSTQRTMALTTVPINLPDDQHYEESEVTESWINFRTNEGRVVEASVEKKGSNQAFAYTLKLAIEKNKSIIKKRRSISAAEYIDLKQSTVAGTVELNCQRICTMEGGLYLIIDYYPKVQNQPLICILQLDTDQVAENNTRIQLPEYLTVDKEITDMPEFAPMKFAVQTKKISITNGTEEESKQEATAEQKK